jgi:excisionase family DNA binding protein
MQVRRGKAKMKDNQKLAYRPAQFAEAVGLSKGFIYKEIASGNLRAKKVGRASVIRANDGERWLATREPAAKM